MHIDLTGKQGLVTGSTAGIGLAIAIGLARAGAQVTLVGRDGATLDAAVDGVNHASGRQDASGVVADPGVAEGCRTVIAARPDTDILVNNVGIYGARPFFQIDDAAWEEIFQVNVMSGVRLARHYAQGMQARGWGRIQFISSESALNIPAEMVHYGVSKAALQGVSRGLAKVLAGSGVTVNAIGLCHLEISSVCQAGRICIPGSPKSVEIIRSLSGLEGAENGTEELHSGANHRDVAGGGGSAFAAR